MNPIHALTAVLLAASAPLASAELVFETHGSTVSGIDTASGEMEVDGVTLTIEAGGEGDDAVLAATSNKDDTLLGVGVATSERKNGNLDAGETLTLTFDREVELLRLNFGFVGTDAEDAATFQLGDAEPVSVYGSKNDPVVDPATEGVSFENGEDAVTFEPGRFVLPAGTPILLSNGSTTGQTYHLNRVTVEATAPAEPD